MVARARRAARSRHSKGPRGLIREGLEYVLLVLIF